MGSDGHEERIEGVDLGGGVGGNLVRAPREE